MPVKIKHKSGGKYQIDCTRDACDMLQRYVGLLKHADVKSIEDLFVFLFSQQMGFIEKSMEDPESIPENDDDLLAKFASPN